MNKIAITTVLIFLLLMFTGLVLADSKHHQDKDDKTSVMAMSEMKSHMDKMQSLMKQAQNTKSTKKQQELMQAHMKEMMQGMDIMNNMTMQAGVGHEMNGKSMMDSNDIAMKKRQDSIEKRMAMMQQMMRHMMDQQSMMGQSMMKKK